MDQNEQRIVQQMIEEATKGFADFKVRKRGDTPTDSYQLTPQKYVDMSGPVASRPIASIANIGQSYYATDTNIPMTFDGLRWRNGVGSVVTSN